MNQNKRGLSAGINQVTLMPKDVTDQICAFDSQNYWESQKDYVKDNAFSYYVVCNSWLLVAKEIVGDRWTMLFDVISHHGLLEAIGWADGASKSIIRNEEIPLGIPVFARMVSTIKSKRERLQLLRFPKRFSLQCQQLEDLSLDDFFISNRMCKNFFVNDDLTYKGKAQHDVRAVLERILAGYNGDDIGFNGAFSGGACSDAKTYVEKMSVYCGCHNSYMSTLYPLVCGKRDFVTYDARFGQRTIHPIGVPKSFNKARIIAPEECSRQWYMQDMRQRLENCISENGFLDYLDIHDQSKSRDLCDIGSRTGNLATVDLHAASDRLSRNVCCKLLPSSVYEDLITWLPRYFTRDGKSKIRVHMLASAGSAVTFVIESCIFLAIAIVATEYTQAYYTVKLHQPRTYGDDFIVDSRVYGYLIWLLELLGLEVNEGKSYAGYDLLYREACGAEFEEGIDLTSVYFPRKVLSITTQSNKATTISSLIDLQHRVYDRFPQLARYLGYLVRSYIPEMTSHYPGTMCDDLWEEVPIIQPYQISLESKGPRYVRLDLFKDPKAVSLPTYREKHFKLTVVYQHVDLTPKQRDDFHMQMYVDFLRHGPRYLSLLDELLGVSESRLANPKLGEASSQYRLSID